MQLPLLGLGPEQKAMEVFLGTWNGKAEMKPGPFGPGGSATGGPGLAPSSDDSGGCGCRVDTDERGARAIAVSTGPTPAETLAAERPDALFSDFSDVAAAAEAILR